MVLMRGNLDDVTRRELDREVRQLLAAAPRAVVVDMADVEFIDAAWIEVLMQLGGAGTCDRGEPVIRISAVSDAARDILVASGTAALVEMPDEAGEQTVTAPMRPGQACGTRPRTDRRWRTPETASDT